MVPELCYASVLGHKRKVLSLPSGDPHEDPPLVISFLWSSLLSASAMEALECLWESVEVAVVGGTESAEVEGTEMVVKDDDFMFAMGCATCTACARCACVHASRWEGNSSSASLAGSRTLLEAIRVRLVLSVSFEPVGWAMVEEHELRESDCECACQR